MKHLGIITLALPDFGSFARQPRSRWARTDDRSTGACPELSLTRVALTVTPPAREARVGAAGAALLDLRPRRDPSAAGIANGVASTGGIGLGVFISALIVEVLPAPRLLPYVAAFVLLAIALMGTLAMPEPVKARSHLRL